MCLFPWDFTKRYGEQLWWALGDAQNSAVFFTVSRHEHPSGCAKCEGETFKLNIAFSRFCGTFPILSPFLDRSILSSPVPLIFRIAICLTASVIAGEIGPLLDGESLIRTWFPLDCWFKGKNPSKSLLTFRAEREREHWTILSTSTFHQLFPGF